MTSQLSLTLYYQNDEDLAEVLRALIKHIESRAEPTPFATRTQDEVPIKIDEETNIFPRGLGRHDLETKNAGARYYLKTDDPYLDIIDDGFILNMSAIFRDDHDAGTWLFEHAEIGELDRFEKISDSVGSYFPDAKHALSFKAALLDIYGQRQLWENIKNGFASGLFDTAVVTECISGNLGFLMMPDGIEIFEKIVNAHSFLVREGFFQLDARVTVLQENEDELKTSLPRAYRAIAEQIQQGFGGLERDPLSDDDSEAKTAIRLLKEAATALDGHDPDAGPKVKFGRRK